MPAAVKKVPWKCSHCGKRRWLKPCHARVRKYCSHECHHAALRNPAKPPKPKATFGVAVCEQCHVEYEAKSAHQRFCSRPCSTANVHQRRIREDVLPRPCEYCGETFRPRPGGAGRFCSRPCTYAGSTGEKAAHFRGGRNLGAGGYVRVQAPDHPSARSHGGYVLEHRLIMEEVLGRYLERHETVHHINGDKTDNRPENLQLRSGRHGKGVAHQCLDCGSFNVEAVALLH